MKRLETDRIGASLALGAMVALVGLAAAASIFDWSGVAAVLSPLCHQREGRCPTTGEVPWALCWRCIGIYAGIGIGSAAWAARPFRMPYPVAFLVGAVFSNLFDFLGEVSGFYDNLAWLRLSNGLILGLTMAVCVFIHWRFLGKAN